MKENNLTVDQSLKEELVERRRGHHVVENYRAKWIPAEIVLLGKLFEDGYGISEIAVILKRSELATIQQLQENKLFREINKKDPNKQKRDKCLCEKCEMKYQCSKNIDTCELKPDQVAV